MRTENLPTLKIHRLSQEQYDREKAAGNLETNALYLTPDSRSTDILEIENGGTGNDVGYIQTGLLTGKTAGDCATSEGKDTEGTGDYAHAEGHSAVASGIGSHAEGRKAKATYMYTHAEGYDTLASGAEAHAEGYQTEATQQAAHAEGYKTKATGKGAHAEGGNFDENGTELPALIVGYQDDADNRIEVLGPEAQGIHSHAEGAQNAALGYTAHVEGYGNYASGDYSHASGIDTIATGAGAYAAGSMTEATGTNSRATGYNTRAVGKVSNAHGFATYANHYQHVTGKYNRNDVATPASEETQSSGDGIFMVGYGTSTKRANALRISSGGDIYTAKAITVNGDSADFAEYFEWADGNPEAEDRRGLFVTLEGDKIKLATMGDDYIGVVSGSGAIIANGSSEEWHGTYLTDVFGTCLYKEIEVFDEETGANITTTQLIVNPEYDETQPYVSRADRKEWAVVGLLGQIVMIDDGTCVVGGYAAPFIDGVATYSTRGYRVMKRIDENHIKVLVK